MSIAIVRAFYGGRSRVTSGNICAAGKKKKILNEAQHLIGFLVSCLLRRIKQEEN